MDYLLENNFIVYICSGTNRFTVRGLIDGVIDIPARQVIGTDFSIVASGQGEEMDMHYSYTEDDELLMGGTLITKNVKMSKVAQMEQELGQKPVLVFGNSTGDVPMAIYADTDNQYLTEVFFIFAMIRRESTVIFPRQKRLQRSARNMDGKRFLWKTTGLLFTATVSAWRNKPLQEDWL